MKRLILLLALVALGLTACSGGGAYDRAYTASGDGRNELELSRTRQFRSNDDLNVVVKLNTHDSDVEVKVIFINSNSQQEGDPLVVVAGPNTGTVVLGLDWESKPDGELWRSGSWEAVIEVDGEEVERLSFEVGS